MIDETTETEQVEENEEITVEDRAYDCAKFLGYEPKDINLLKTALTHRSYSAEHGGVENNERLEFLGDAVLDLVLSDILFLANKDMPEGELAKARSAVVNEDTLADIATEINLGSYMFFGVGEAKSGGANKRSILADAMEAVIAAMYLDLGYEFAKSFVSKHWESRAQISANNPGIADYKTRFQEAIVKFNSSKPRYYCEAIGPEHNRVFNAHVYSNDIEMGSGVGRSKKIAEQDAARNALEYLEKLESQDKK
ncbi:MAG: ribonuclease III [Acidimicrobiia bacterium]